MKRKMCQGNAKRTPDEHFSETEMWTFLSSALDKKRAAKRRRPDMYREALLQRTVQRINDEITERSMKRTKKRKSEEKYEWQDGPNGWCMTDEMSQDDDDDDLLGINSFLSGLSSSKPNKHKREENRNEQSAVLPSFSETFGENRTKKLNSKCVDEQRSTSSGSNMAPHCRAGLFQKQISLVEKFDSLCC